MCSQVASLAPQKHSPLEAPIGSELKSFYVGDGSYVQTYWTQTPNNIAAMTAIITIHGAGRDGDRYWNVTNFILNSAMQANFPGVDPNTIIVVPQFFSRLLNSGQ